MKSVMQHDFSRIPRADIPRSVFNRSCGHKTTFDSGKLIPVFCDEVLPGDTFNLQSTMFARLTTPLYPVMDNMYLDVHYFFVPNRLIWTNWQKFCGEQIDPEDSTDYTIPQVVMPASTGIGEQTLFDYLGVPTKIPDLSVSALPSRAYNLIYNEWFRDQNLIDSIPVDKDDGPDTVTDYVIQRRGKRHDYFTSCLPWPQKDPDSVISLPLGTSAPVNFPQVTGSGNDIGAYSDVDGAYRKFRADSTYLFPSSTASDVDHSLYADLANAVAPTINDLREAFQLQRMLERDARGGTRYAEIIRSHFGVISPDQRLQRPEYLGGTSAPVHITAVAQTAEGTTTPVGKLSAIGTITAKSGFSKSFTEHGHVIGIVSVRADLTYQQGLPRMFSRSTRYDYYWPALAHLGEQEVLMKEIYAVDPATDTDADGTSDNDEVFGYQERWAEYRYKQSQITGQFRSNSATPLDAWHLSQEFGSAPTLSQTFIEETPPIDRVVADADDPEFYFDSFFSYRCARAMPVYGVPGLIDHF